MHADVRWIPNALTALRFLLLPVVLVLVHRVGALTVAAGLAPAAPLPTEPLEWTWQRATAVALFLLLALTDWFDGYLARRYDVTSRWGSTADAVADRLAFLLPLAYIALRDTPGFAHVPLWIPIWLLTLDVLLAVVWLVANRTAGVSRPEVHNQPGRVAAWLLFLLVLWVLAAFPPTGIVVLGATGLGLATISAALYLRQWLGGGGARAEGVETQ